MSNPDKAMFKAFNESTLADAEAVVCAAFKSDGMKAYLRKILASPYANEVNAGSYGDIAYVDGKPVAFQATYLHRLYDGQTPFNATVGSSLGVVPGTSPVVLLDLMKQSILPRNCSRFWFANTAIKTAAKLNRLIGVSEKGGVGWKGYRYAVVHTLRFLRYLLGTRFFRKVAIRTMEHVPLGMQFEMMCDGFRVVRKIGVDEVEFNGFWRRYIETNNGIVSSRTAEEIDWMFGENIKSGRDVLLAAYKGEVMLGDVILRSMADGRWKIVDMIAVGNEPETLSAMLSAAKKFLRKHTHAVMLRVFGFPAFNQPLLERHFPHHRPGDSVPFVYQSYDIPQKTSWFFGPYDGDAAF